MVALLEARVCVSCFRSNEIPLVDGMMSFTNAGNRKYTDLDSCNARFSQQEASRHSFQYGRKLSKLKPPNCFRTIIIVLFSI